MLNLEIKRVKEENESLAEHEQNEIRISVKMNKQLVTLNNVNHHLRNEIERVKQFEVVSLPSPASHKVVVAEDRDLSQMSPYERI